MCQNGTEGDPWSKRSCWRMFPISKHNFDRGWVYRLVLFAPAHCLHFASLYSLVQGVRPELCVLLRAGRPNRILTWRLSQLVVSGEVVGRLCLCGCQRWVPLWCPSFACHRLTCSGASCCRASTDSSIKANLDGDWIQFARHWWVKIGIRNQVGCHDLHR
jgi:hypothetical protein